MFRETKINLSEKEIKQLKKSYDKYIKNLDNSGTPLNFNDYLNQVLHASILEHKDLTKYNYKIILEYEINEIQKELNHYREQGIQPHTVFKKYVKKCNIIRDFNIKDIETP